ISEVTIEDFNDYAISIASTDLSHTLKEYGPYSYYPYRKKLDQKIVNILKERNKEEIITFDLNLSQKAGECGLRSLMIMAGTLDSLKFDSDLLSYEGPYGVGYATARFEITGEDGENNLIGKINEINQDNLDNIRKE